APKGEVAGDHVEDQRAPGVADVGEIVHRDAADVDSDLTGGDGAELLLLPAQGVVDAEAHAASPSSTSATAIAAIPSWRPRAPSRSACLALMLIRSTARSRVSASRFRIGSRYAASRGASAPTVASPLPI